MIAIGYIRRSKKSDEKVISLEAQKAAIESYCNINQIALADIIIHDGVSGGKRQRFNILEHRRAEVNAQAVIVYDLDRLARDNPGMLSYLEGLLRDGIEFHETVMGKLDYSTAEGIFMTQVRGAAQELYRNLARRKTKAALQHLKAAGRRYTRIAPFGFTWVDGKLATDAEEQRAIEMIAECRRMGLSVRKTMRHIRGSGYAGRLGRMTVYTLMTDPPTIKNKLPAHYFALPPG